MNAQVKFPLRLSSTPFCRFRVRCHFHFVAFAFKKRSSSVSFVSPRYRFVAFAFHSLRLHSVSFCSFSWRLHCKAVGIHVLLPQAPPFFYSTTVPSVLWTCSCCFRISFVLRTNVCFSWFCLPFSWICRPFFMDLLSVFRLSFKRSLSVRCMFNARFVLAFTLNENGKKFLNLGCGFWLHTEGLSTALSRECSICQAHTIIVCVVNKCMHQDSKGLGDSHRP